MERSHTFDLSKLFKDATNLDLFDFYAFVISAMSRFHRFDPEKFLKDPLSYSLDEQWFSSAKMSSEAIQAFFSLVAATPEEYKQRCKQAEVQMISRRFGTGPY